jgi:hypothetical protein
VADDRFREIWRRAEAHMDQARLALTDPADGALALFEEFRDHNELGLALDQLADVADAQRALRAMWEELQAAATVMELHQDDPGHGATVRRINAHLSRST